ncbi:MAG: bifunctional adenosylcobinamide kinase/adenosylcobinamide-phosphate guanylyltransferase [Nitrospiraceae bacterium]|nr:bifunctional adenosylcobinamide kinase/adenosylcobinamide-phosphate guanylyltransferase [Nitrospiraceae bacterium]
MNNHQGRKVFVLGGARSGKSALALARASALPGKKAYIATAQAFDDEMEVRRERHRLERLVDWDTFEEPLDLPGLLVKIRDSHDVILIDCLTLWLSNLMLADRDILKETESFISALTSVRGSLFAVSNEVGFGIVSENEMARKFRDLAGTLNQRAAAVADQVYLVAAGIPIKIKEI